MKLRLLSDAEAAEAIERLRREHGLDSEELLGYYEHYIYKVGLTPGFAEYLSIRLGESGYDTFNTQTTGREEVRAHKEIDLPFKSNKSR